VLTISDSVLRQKSNFRSIQIRRLAESLDAMVPLLLAEGAFLSSCPFFPIELARLVYAGSPRGLH
jgi:hypothetical protein